MGYVEAQEGADSRTAFRQAEKKYKRYKEPATAHRRRKGKGGGGGASNCLARGKHGVDIPRTDLSEAIDFLKLEARGFTKESNNSVAVMDAWPGIRRLEGAYEWPVFTIDRHPGLYFLSQALTPAQQAHLIKQSLARFPQPPNRTNHNVLYGPLHDLWECAQQDFVLVRTRHQHHNHQLSEMENSVLHRDNAVLDDKMKSLFSSETQPAPHDPPPPPGSDLLASFSSGSNVHAGSDASTVDNLEEENKSGGCIGSEQITLSNPRDQAVRQVITSSGKGEGVTSELLGTGPPPLATMWRFVRQQSVISKSSDTARNKSGGGGYGTTEADEGLRTGRIVNQKDRGGRKKEDEEEEEEERAAMSGSKDMVTAKVLLRKLRWATVGIQFDWGKKGYDFSLPCADFPEDLAMLASTLAKPALELQDDNCRGQAQKGESGFCAEAAIVNFYGADDTLGGHLDDMEGDLSKPIVSLSLGLSAVFLIGGETRDNPPTAIILRSGDVVLMARHARHCYHGVPRIFLDKDDPTVSLGEGIRDFSEPWFLPFQDYISQTRININVRQVR